MIFAIFMIVLAIVLSASIGILMGSVWAALGFVALLILLYRLGSYQSALPRPITRDQVNAFQRPLSDSKRDS